MTTRVAILDDTLPTQAATSPEELDGLTVVWSGTDASELRRRMGELAPHVVVCSLPLLGADPTAVLEQLESEGSVELFILLYNFARRGDLRALEGDRRRVVQAPLSIARLRSQMMSVVVSHLLGSNAASRAESSSRPRAATTRASIARSANAPSSGGAASPRRFSAAQLGRLMEYSSAVECECPNHLAQLVGSLSAFEDYAAACESKNDADVEVHRMLHAQTARARAVMEEALARLVEHERIAV